MAIRIGKYEKAPGDTLFATVNFGPDLPSGVTLASATTTNVPSGLTVSTTTNDSTTATPIVSGGRAGHEYPIDVVGTYSDGQVRTFTVVIVVV